MNRASLEEMGLSKEQIDSIMAENGKDIQREKAKAESLREKADKSDDLQKQLDEINNKSLTEVEKANKALETANNRIAELEKAQMIATLKATVTEKFKITGEQASQIIKEDGTMDYDILATIISEKETAAAKAKEIEIANGSSNVGGGAGSGAGGNGNKTEAEKLAETVGKSLANNNKSASDVVNAYL